MKELVSLHDINEDTNIEAVIDEIMEAHAQFDENDHANRTLGGTERDEGLDGSQPTVEGEMQ